jgi:signal peptidase II
VSPEDPIPPAPSHVEGHAGPPATLEPVASQVAEPSSDFDPISAGPTPLISPLEVIAIGTIVVVDQITKFVVRSTIPLYAKHVIIPNLLDVTHVQNTGAAFGLLNAADFPYKSAVMIGIATLALVAISIYARQLGAHERLSRYGLALILGGAFGNLIDRAIAGYVVDFVDVYWGEAHFWAFNVADAAITIGAILVLLEMVGIGRRHAPHSV